MHCASSPSTRSRCPAPLRPSPRRAARRSMQRAAPVRSRSPAIPAPTMRSSRPRAGRCRPRPQKTRGMDVRESRIRWLALALGLGLTAGATAHAQVAAPEPGWLERWHLRATRPRHVRATRRHDRSDRRARPASRELARLRVGRPLRSAPEPRILATK